MDSLLQQTGGHFAAIYRFEGVELDVADQMHLAPHDFIAPGQAGFGDMAVPGCNLFRGGFTQRFDSTNQPDGRRGGEFSYDQ